VAPQAEPEPLTASIEVAAAPATVWRVLSDVRRTGEWSPECRRVLPLGQVRVGALLVGVNRRGRVRWVTLSRVISCETDREIGWRVLTNRSEWRYRLAATPAGTAVTQTRRTPRGEGRFALWFTRAFLEGQAAHDAELAEGMARGLERIRQLAEALEQPTVAVRA
jgi:polyketide cyclase/dehydrase/lipid transport protein